MSASSKPRSVTLKASGAITNNTFVKFGATKDLVAQCGLNERAIGVFNGEGNAADADFVEIMLPGSGARLKVAETIALGKMLTSTAAGLGEVADAASEWVGAIAYEDGVANDVIGVELTGFQAVGTDA